MAKAWLDEHGVEYVDRDNVTDNPSAEELATWIARSGLPVRRFFNSSGMKYRELGLKARLDAGNDGSGMLRAVGDRRHAG